MSESIAGYIDKSYIKGQYYRYAASPKPVVFTGNIDTVSEDLLCKAMLVNKGVASGTFPTDAGSSFLITTEKYGDDIYLQVAYLLLSASGFNCYEYRRVYTNSTWTDWISTDADIASMDSRIQEAKDSADNCVAGLQTVNSQVSNLNSKVNVLNNQTVPGLTNNVSSLDNRLKAVETKTSTLGVSLLWSGNYTTSGTLEFPYGSYNAYLIVGVVRSGGSKVSQLHVKPQLTVDDIRYQVNDEDEYYTYKLRYSGNKVILTYYARSATYQGGGSIQEIWGIN